MRSDLYEITFHKFKLPHRFFKQKIHKFFFFSLTKIEGQNMHVDINYASKYGNYNKTKKTEVKSHLNEGILTS